MTTLIAKFISRCSRNFLTLMHFVNGLVLYECCFVIKSGGGVSALRLFSLGTLTLFLELIFIRYLAGNIWNLGYFPNFVLIAAFIGIGVGFTFNRLLSAEFSLKAYTLLWLPIWMLVMFVLVEHPSVPGFGTSQGALGGELFFTNAPREKETGYFHFYVIFPSLLFIFAVLSQRTARLFVRFRPLTAYTLDIAGSCAGILLFMLISFFGLPAWTWFLIAGALFFIGAESRNLYLVLSGVAAAATIGTVFIEDTHSPIFESRTGFRSTKWSPYQKVEYVKPKADEGTIYVNGLGHQAIMNSDELKESFYQIPYDLRSKRKELPKYKDVLVLGAGTGNDVATALLNGVEHVDAVEIDPVIAEIGTKHHPANPYSDSRVVLTVDDGRAFMGRTPRKYDLIIFALTDSVVKASAVTQLRLENYLFTVESVKRAYSLLKPEGELLFYNQYRTTWLVEKIAAMIRAGTGRYPGLVYKKDDFAILSISKTEIPGTYAAVKAADKTQITTDDWPFLYLQKRAIPGMYLVAGATLAACIAVLILIFRVMSAKLGPAGVSSPLLAGGFFVMGAAFLLLETKSIVEFSLLFGTTWLNNSLVFLAVLLLVLLANWTATFLPKARAGLWIFALLLISALASLIYPLGNLLEVESRIWRFVFAALLTFSPIYFANLMFSIEFRDRDIPDQLFGWNLLGATVGGIVEYVSMIAGYNRLAVIVAVSYTIAFILFSLARRKQKQLAV